MLVFNKVDVCGPQVGRADSVLAIWRRHVSSVDHPSRCLFISCISGEGLCDIDDALSEAVKKVVYGDDSDNAAGGLEGGILITRQRHRTHLQNCVGHLSAFLEETLPMDLAAEELRLSSPAYSH